jgi:putative heme-binding domain-containing protein
MISNFNRSVLALALLVGAAVGGSASAQENSKEAPAAVKGKKKGGAVTKDGKPAEPTLVPATPEVLKSEVTAPEEFEVSVFATPQQANYPVYVAASPEGTVYVASDGNGSLGTQPGRGRIIRLRDTDNDGRADEVKVFATVDSPRGLVWDRDRLYLMHPPHLSAFIDKDGDGVSDEQRILVKNIGWGFKDRPADHASNGVTLGIDGWLYLAIGDFGFTEAVGTDGRKLQFRGGGVVRVRTDGSGLELYSSGTRNILEVSLSPLLDGIARDNTNDGDGWDVRLHHFTGLEDHGYPVLYKNFADDQIAPLADYGGGSGCAGLWLDEPGIPDKWNRAPLTVDWGREAIFRHPLTPKGATFAAGQEQFVKIPRATDLDVDAQSRIYVSSWRGGKFNYIGPEIGYIARLTPKGYTPPAVPDFSKLTPAELVKLFSADSSRIRLAAQRELLSRDVRPVAGALEALAANASQPLASRVLAVFTLKQALGETAHAILAKLAKDATIAAWAIRALADHERQLTQVPPEPIVAALKSSDARTKLEAVVALARLGRAEHAPALTRLLGSDDPVIAHTVVKSLVRLRAVAPCFSVLDQADAPSAARTGALRVLQTLHEEAVVDGLISRLKREADSAQRDDLVRALCRLYYVEGKWAGDGWGTRPDNRGPYYQPERWSASARINAVLSELLDRATGDDAVRLNAIFALHRVQPGDVVGRLMALAATDEAVLPTLVETLAASDSVPASALPLLERAAKPGKAQVNAMFALIKLGTADAMRVALTALPTVPKNGTRGDASSDKVSNALFLSPALENHHAFFETEAAKLEGLTSAWADAALLHLAARRFGAPEARERARHALDEGWKTPARRAQIIRAAALGREASRAAAIVAACDDADAAVATAAKAAVASLKLDVDAIRAEAGMKTPTIAELKADEVLTQVMTQGGDRVRGEQLFSQAGCVACHTVRSTDPMKGPFLGNITTLYRRRELAEAILDPNKTIAQGFVTNQFTLKDGSSKMGFVTREAPDVVAIRDIAGQQHEVRVSDVAKREHLPISLMPPGLMGGFTVRDFAGLLDYLESLSTAGN